MLTKLRVFLQFQRGILFQYGWIVSWWRGKPVDRHGKPLPWITYSAIDFLKQFDFSNSSVFEWGSGFSTMWWSERCKDITTIEAGAEWAEYIRPQFSEKVTMLTPAFDQESEAATIDKNDRQYQVIIVDNNGPFRAACAERAIPHLADGGFIILDNSDQCLVATQRLRNAGFTQIDFTGFAPANSYAQSTSIFFRGRISIPSLFQDLPVRSVAQPNSPWPNC